jgi:hypothetical protein
VSQHVVDADNLSIKTIIDDEVVQDSNTKWVPNLIFGKRLLK